MTNNFTIEALTVADLYKARWKVEIFFKWIKQHLRIKAFFVTGELSGAGVIPVKLVLTKVGNGNLKVIVDM